MCAGRLFCLLVCLLLFCLLAGISDSYAAATLLLEEPYSYDGAFAGTGHSAVYLSNVCADSPVVLRTCTAGETGVVLSRYDGIQGYDWVAIPLISYLYAVDRAAAVPLFADVKLVAFLRDRYRREHLEALAPDRADGGTPEGNWYELVGASYDRTIYGFEIETSAQQDALLIANFNRGPNRERYNFVKRNCADFVREVINFYYPHALHRSVIGDLGVTTPKQIAKMLVRYSQHHPELESSDFLVPQVPGSVGRSKPVHGVLESVMAAKKYMLPLVVLHPYIGGGLLVEYFGHRRFDPGRNALVLNSQFELDSPLTKDERATYQSRVNELGQVSTGRLRDDEPAGEKASPLKGKELKVWEHLQAGAMPAMDASGEPVLQMHFGDDLAQVGLTHANVMNGSGVLNGSDSRELAAQLLEARIRQELRPSATRKTSHSDVEKDLSMLRQLRSSRRAEAAEVPVSSSENRTRVLAVPQ